MTTCLALAALATTLAAAARSTWSPCGLSMLASITPMSEAGRGHRYRSTATWFVSGSAIGGITLGLAMAPLALSFGAMSLTTRQTATIALGAAIVTAASDVGLGGFRLPVHHRQVNERWLDQFRPWVYGAGFGWQIGTGLSTYIVTAAVYLMMVLSVVTGQVWLAVGVGTLFGLVRGLSVFLGRQITSSQSLQRFHHRFQELGPLVRRIAITTQLLVATLFGWVLSPWLALGVVAVGFIGAIALRRRTLERPTVVPHVSQFRG